VNIEKFARPINENETHMVDAALKGLKRVRSNWLRDPNVVAVDVGYRLLHGRPIGPQVFNYYEAEEDAEGAEINGARLSPEELSERLGITLESALEAARKKISKSKLKSEGILRDGYSFPWIRVHVDRKMTPTELTEHHRRPYHKLFLEEDGKRFEVHVVEALYEPMAGRVLNPEIDHAFHELCDAQNGDWEKVLRPGLAGSIPEKERVGVAREVALSHLEAALDKRYVPQSVKGVAIERTAAVDPLTGGISIGNTRRQVGTLGAIVWDNTDCKPCILSCWHVLDGGRVEIGERCLQPAKRDGGSMARNTVGRLKRSQLGRNVDAALAEVTGERTFSAGTILCGPDGCGAISIAGVSHAESFDLLGTKVWKSGRSTGITRGIIDGVGMSLSVSYADGSRENFYDQLHILPDWPDEVAGVESTHHDCEVSKAGDSGALWLDDKKMAVGLNFAGDACNSEMGDFAVANRMTDVEREMDISFSPVFMHPRAMAERQREDDLRAALRGGLPTPATQEAAHQLVEVIGEILGRVIERFDETDVDRAMTQIRQVLGPHDQPRPKPGG